MFLFLQTRAWHPAKLLPLLAWYAAGSVCVTVRLPVLSVCPMYGSSSPHAAAAGLLLWARRAGNIDRLLHGRRSAANAGGVTLSAGVGS